MPVRLKNSTARQIARLLDQHAGVLQAEFSNNSPEARHLANDLRHRAGPPKEPIRQWVEKHSESLGLETEDDVESATDAIQAAIEIHSDKLARSGGDLI